jgi:integrase/recombinase XerD
MKKRKTKRSIPDPLTEDEAAALLKIPNRRYPTGFRNYVIIRLMLSAGLRCNETLTLGTRDVDLMSGRMKVNGKGNKDRILWLDADMLDLMQQWRERRRVESEFYFTTLKGRPLKPRYVRAMIERYKRRAGIARRCSPHSLRHTFATNLLRETGNIEIVRKALGHEDISTTGIYLHCVDFELESAMKAHQAKIPK